MRRLDPALLPILLLVSNCATIDKLAQLPNIDFKLDGTTGTALAGIPLEAVHRVEDLRAGEVLQIAAAVQRGSLPLRFDLHVGAENGAPYAYDLHLEKLEWTLLLEDRETVSGVLERDVVINPSGSTDIAVPVELDLLRFFDDGANDLMRLALRVAGVGNEATNVKLRARPTLRTPFGSYRFPNEITVSDQV